MGAPYRLLVDGAAASVLARGLADVVLIGADRIAANGDTANKIGSYALALAARQAEVPFLVVAPESTIDAATPTAPGSRSRSGMRARSRPSTASAQRPVEARTLNPAFDVTPASLITAIVTDAAGHPDGPRARGPPERDRLSCGADRDRDSSPADEPCGGRRERRTPSVTRRSSRMRTAVRSGSERPC